MVFKMKIFSNLDSIILWSLLAKVTTEFLNLGRKISSSYRPYKNKVMGEFAYTLVIVQCPKLGNPSP